MSHDVIQPSLTVSELNSQVRRLLEMNYHNVRVVGELSSLSRPSSGHWYFTLKDSQAQIRCAMFRMQNQRITFQPQDGMKLLLRGRLSLYEGRGDYQLIVEHMSQAGAGDLQQQFERLKQQLAAEGLFEPMRKRSLPHQPQHIGIITSPTGAAVQDILTVLKRRFPSIPVTIIPTAVQGEQAKFQIVQALQQAQQSQLFDVLIVGRGGGSMEDLWPFNEEIVARAIANCTIPVVSSVGHEVDFTIADFVADYRAPTPSAAAEILSPDQYAIKQQLQQLSHRLQQLWTYRLQQQQQRLDYIQQRLRHPKEQLQWQQQRLNALSFRLQQSIQLQIEQQRQQLTYIKKQPLHTLLTQQTNRKRQQLVQHSQRLVQQIQQKKQVAQFQLQYQAVKLNAMSPLNTLARGYAIVTTKSGDIIYNSEQVSVNGIVNIQLHQGSLRTSVVSSKDKQKGMATTSANSLQSQR